MYIYISYCKKYPPFITRETSFEQTSISLSNGCPMENIKLFHLGSQAEKYFKLFAINPYL